ncbi:MAG: hypothetical protein HYY43_01770 [Deltaproteobacteria bacterium]|nr:hypothetical protein [Deltaproteobacteria bacterium]MBI2974305.1 hypothetical protein [Deltaproteobacteria bacterium]
MMNLNVTKINKVDMKTNHFSKVLTPTEVLIYNLCDGKLTRDEIADEVIHEIKDSSKNPHEEFCMCLETLKKKGLIVY